MVVGVVVGGAAMMRRPCRTNTHTPTVRFLPPPPGHKIPPPPPGALAATISSISLLLIVLLLVNLFLTKRLVIDLSHNTSLSTLGRDTCCHWAQASKQTTMMSTSIKYMIAIF